MCTMQATGKTDDDRNDNDVKVKTQLQQYTQSFSIVVKNIQGILFKFLSPDNPVSFIRNDYDVIQTALKYPDFEGVQICINHNCDPNRWKNRMKDSKIYLMEFLYGKHIINQGNTILLTYQHTFEEILNKTLENWRAFELELLQKFDNSHFDICFYSIPIQSQRKEFNITSILCNYLNHNAEIGVCLSKRCLCTTICNTIPTTKWCTYQELFVLLQRISPKSLQDLRYHTVLPPSNVCNKKLFFSIS